MDLMEILTAVGTWGGATTIFSAVGTWLYRKQNKRLKESEAALAEANVAKAKVEGKADEFHIWKEQCEALSDQNRALIERNTELVKINAEKEDRHQQDIKDWEERFDKQTDRLRSVQRDLIASNDREKEHIRKEARLEKERDHYKMWFCRREHVSLDPENGCGRRLPMQFLPIKYIPLDSDMTEKKEEGGTTTNEVQININLEKE